MSLRSALQVTQPPDAVSLDTPALLVVFIAVVVGLAVAKDPKLAQPIGAACAVTAVLVVVLMR